MSTVPRSASPRAVALPVVTSETKALLWLGGAFVLALLIY